MPHFFVDPGNVTNGRFVLAPDESAHVARVLRKKSGDRVHLFDGVDRSYDGVLDEVAPGRVTGRIVDQRSSPPAGGPFVRLVQAIPKGDTFEWILEKATELGVGEVVAFHARRNVARVSPDRAAAKKVRWEKIVRAASAQCGRPDVPTVSGPLEFDEMVERLDPSQPSFLAWEGEEAVSLKSVLGGRLAARPSFATGAVDPSNNRRGSVESTAARKESRMIVNMIVGPEGGFTPDEVGRARARGIVPVSLGSRILRTETAGLFVVSAVLYESLG